MRTTRLASSQEAFEKRGWAVVAPIFNHLRRRKEFATTGGQDARLREGVIASRSFAMPKGCYRELTGAVGDEGACGWTSLSGLSSLQDPLGSFYQTP